MKEPFIEIVAGAVAVTAGGTAGIAAEGWPGAVLVGLAVASAFGLGARLADRRATAVLAVVRSFLAEAAVHYRASADGRIDDAEAREIAGAVARLFADLEALGELACAREGP